MTTINHNRYLSVMQKLRNRYTDKDGRLVLSVNNRPTRYRQLEDAAAIKYLGCRRDRLQPRHTG
ncbi:hypothetical protein [Marinobacter subterrani]|uniref:hypothetical protein n=1 Tax=Marinobacter subterrani TaxID=1658765 RepID=UPI00235216D6|nr:hypothetical protein [Marinobacter subterrani]